MKTPKLNLIVKILWVFANSQPSKLFVWAPGVLIGRKDGSMPKAKVSTAKVKKVGRDSGTGEFVPVSEAKRRPKTTTVETIKVAPKKVAKKVKKSK